MVQIVVEHAEENDLVEFIFVLVAMINKRMPLIESNEVVLYVCGTK